LGSSSIKAAVFERARGGGTFLVQNYIITFNKFMQSNNLRGFWLLNSLNIEEPGISPYSAWVWCKIPLSAIHLFSSFIFFSFCMLVHHKLLWWCIRCQILFDVVRQCIYSSVYHYRTHCALYMQACSVRFHMVFMV
jgi:hypothetical protein